MSKILACALVPLLATSLSSAAVRHDEDPKVLTPSRATPGPGWRASRQFGGEAAAGGFQSKNVRLLAWLPMAELDGSAGANDCTGYAAPSGREYAIIGTYDSTVFVEISTPADPHVVGIVPGPNSLWRDIEVYQGYSYSVSEGGNGIQVVDLAQIDSGVVTLVNTVTDGGSTATHTVAIDSASGFLYRAGGSGNGLRVYSLADPAHPLYVGGWFDRYVHETHVVTYTSGPYAGRQIAYCCGGYDNGWTATRLDILDVTNKASISLLTSVFYPNAAYAHEGWLTSDLHYYYLGDELDENGVRPTTTHVIDVSDPTNAFWTGSFTNGSLAIGHNLYTRADLVFEANYTSGLRVFDASEPLAPIEVGWFDTAPAGDGASFNGLWGNYPYFPSGVVIGSDRESGLFVLWPGLAPLEFEYPDGLPDLLDPLGQSVSVTILPRTSGVAVTQARLHWDSGAGWNEAPLADAGGGAFDAVFPPVTCGSAVKWFVSAEAPSGVTWTSPDDAPAHVWLATAAHAEESAADFGMELEDGWTSGAPGDGATAGQWVRGDPVGSEAQAEDDHSASGTQCWFTGQGVAGGDADSADLDGGTTSLTSPLLDLAAWPEVVVGYWRWFSNVEGADPSADSFQVMLSTDGGGSWSGVETVGPEGEQVAGGWQYHSFRMADFAVPTSQVLLRFVASDLGPDSTVEAAVDDVRVFEPRCYDCRSSSVCLSLPNSSGQAARIESTGTLEIHVNDFGLHATGCPAGKFGIFFYGPDPAEIPFGNGYLCVGGGLVRLLPLVKTDASGQASRAIDFENMPAGGEITAGETRRFQFWFRDPAAGGSYFDLSDAIEVTFCP
jgi:choice-of-anchor B domain-containing protein